MNLIEVDEEGLEFDFDYYKSRNNLAWSSTRTLPFKYQDKLILAVDYSRLPSQAETLYLLFGDFQYFKASDSLFSRFSSMWEEPEERGVNVDSPAVRIVNDAIREAKSAAASDIHFELSETEGQLRLRIDGELNLYKTIPLAYTREVISRLKILSDIDIAETRRPQDGKIKYLFGGQYLDIRVSTLPTSFGEKVVLRLLDQSSIDLNINNFHIPLDILNDLKTRVKRPNGLILVTGPTGSGKTTTLYSLLNYIKRPEINISTVEDPIEYKIPGINQTQVKPEIGFDFATSLRTLLRQDPNVILLGEIRDKETADLAIRASMTGHLVLSTLHTNDAPSAIYRLQDMGIEPFQISSALSVIVGQRLIKKLCQVCDGVGCAQCSESGFKGRIGVYESVFINGDFVDAIKNTDTISALRDRCREIGWRPLRDDGLAKVKLNLTTLEELDKESY